MPSPVNTLNCLILQSKSGLRFVPNHMPVYFINSKRRFFLYFRSHTHMMEAMRVLSDNGVRFYRRESLLVDREQHEQQVFHCNYRFKKVDLRRSLQPGTPYNDPKLHFDRFDRSRSRQELPPAETPIEQTQKEKSGMHVEAEMAKPQKAEQPKQQVIIIGGHKFKHASAAKALLNKQLLNDVLFSLNIMPMG